MYRSRILSTLCLGALLGAGACGSSSKATGDGGNPDGASTGGSAISFKPSNVDLTGWDLSQIGDVDLSGTNCIIDDEEADGPVALLCDMKFTNHVAHKIVTLADQTKLSIYVMKSLRIEASTVLSLSRGHLPIVLITTGPMELLGSIEVAPGQCGGAFNGNMGFAKGAGPGGGTAGDSTGLAGGGASFCGLGGKAGTFTGAASTAPGAPTPSYGTPELIPLVPGSAGGSGDLANDGKGGGALQLVAGTSFVLHAGAHINVGGGGGVFGGTSLQSSGGGGSGGALLIEALTVKIDGAVGVNGGGGGQGNGDQGEDGHFDTVARGGHKATGAQSDPAGDGSFGTTTSGGDGPSSATFSAAGGCGGAGRIRINTTSGAATISGTISPGAGACMTQGKVAS
jgi:hypothetical protein